MFALLCLIFTLAVAKVRITEVVPHSDVEDGYYDYIELHNTGDKPADISGWFLSDKGSDKTRCLIKANTILGVGEHRSFSCQAAGENSHPLLVGGGYCKFRLSKHNDRVYLGRLDKAGKYELVDDANIGATINRVSNQLYHSSDDKDTYVMAFPTENFGERYPIVGPFVISEIVWAPPAGQQQYIKITCIFGKASYNGAAQLTTRGGYRYQLRFEEQKDLYINDVLTAAAYDLPTSVSLNRGQSLYVVSGDPASFARQMGVASNLVIGPWRGKLHNVTSGNVWLGMYGQEHAGMWVAELIRWKDKEKDGWRKMKNGGIQRVSMNSVSFEPDNWIGIGEQLACNLSSAYPASDCPHLDDCTANLCINQNGKGVCLYDALVCNHPNWEKCYPDHICRLPAPSHYNAGCKLSSAPFGHTTSDTETWGFYTNVPGMGGTVGNEILWYDVGCTKRTLDCDVGGWKDWSKCKSCQDNQNRSRPVQQAPSVNPAGKACPEIFQKRSCNHNGKCKPCDYLKCTLPQICWANNKTFTATCETPVPCVLSEWKDAYCDKTCGGGWAYRYRNITRAAQFGGACDPNQLIATRCNEFPCPSNCQWSLWSEYGACSQTCGGGSQARTRKVVVEAANGGTECTGTPGETRTCNTQTCPTHCQGAWEEWTDCHCLTQRQSRTYIVNEIAQNGGIKCPFADGTVENKTCSVAPCVPIDCDGWWLEWSNCSFASRSQTQEYHVETEPQFGGKACPEPRTQKCTPRTDEQQTAPPSGLPGWAIALIVIGAVVGAALLAGALIAAWTASASGAVPEGAYQQY